MVKLFLKSGYALLMLFGLLLAWQPANAQLDEIKAFLESSEANANTLAEAYLAPLPTGLSTALNSGWTTKAAATKKLGFSIQVRAALAAIPSSAQTFDASILGLQGVTVSGSESNTISGGKGSGQTINGPENPLTGNPTYSFTIPGGTGVSYVPAAMLQGNLGLIKDTDITVRYIPDTDLGSYGNIALFGAGIKHGLNQWIPGGKLLPVDISVMAAFSQIDLNAVISESNNQYVETTTNTFVVNALVGKTLPFISAYAGVGVQSGSFELNMLGNYDIGSGPTAQTLTDPISFTKDSDAAIHALAGAQFKLAIFRIFGEVTIAEYSTYNVGIGIGLRN
jgi:hypothetical protein